MAWNLQLIFYIVSLVVCLCGFKKYVYFLSIGYGFSIAGIGAAMFVLSFMGKVPGNLALYIQFALFIIYGFRLSGFLLIREFKNVLYRKTLKEATGDEVPGFVKFFMWIMVAALYVAQTSAVTYRFTAGGVTTVCQWIGIAICALGIALEAIADNQKTAQKKENPNKVAMKGLYKMVRCPNYFGEITFWTGVFVSSLDILKSWGQWAVVIFAYIAIVYIMFDGAKRSEARQIKRCGSDPEFIAYANKTPIIIPFLPIYHLYDEQKEAAKKAKKANKNK